MFTLKLFAGTSNTPATLTMLVPIRPTFWLERRLDWREARPEPRQHLLQHVIAPHPQFAADDLYLGMAIAEMPCQARRDGGLFGGILRRNLDQRLGPGDHRDDLAVVEQEPVAIAQRHHFRQIEQKLAATLSDHDDPPPIALVGVEYHVVDGVVHAPRADGQNLRRPLHGAYTLRDFRFDQNRKYRWAIGSTSAGAQVKSSPSALTS